MLPPNENSPWLGVQSHQGLPQDIPPKTGEALLLTVEAFLLTVELFCLQSFEVLIRSNL